MPTWVATPRAESLARSTFIEEMGNDWPGRTQTLCVHSIWPTATPRPTAWPGITSPHSQTWSPHARSPALQDDSSAGGHNDTHRQLRRVNSSSTRDLVWPIACFSSVTLDYRRSSRWLCSDTRSRVARHSLHEHAAFHHEHRETWIILPLEPRVHFCTPTTLRRQHINAFSSPHVLEGRVRGVPPSQHEPRAQPHGLPLLASSVSGHNRPLTHLGEQLPGLGSVLVNIQVYADLTDEDDINTETLHAMALKVNQRTLSQASTESAYEQILQSLAGDWRATAQFLSCGGPRSRGLLHFHPELHAQRWTIKRLLLQPDYALGIRWEITSQTATKSTTTPYAAPNSMKLRPTH